MVECSDVGVHVIQIVRVGRVVSIAPLVRGGNIRVKHRVLRLGLIINRVETNDILEETVKIRMRGGGDGDLEQWSEEIVKNILET